MEKMKSQKFVTSELKGLIGKLDVMMSELSGGDALVDYQTPFFFRLYCWCQSGILINLFREELIGVEASRSRGSEHAI